MPEHVVIPDDIELPLPTTEGGFVLHGEFLTFVIYSTYYASDKSALRYVLIECAGLGLSRFGYPNDEGLGEHRLYNKGLGNTHGIGEVRESELLQEYESMRRHSHERIWDGRGMPPKVQYSSSLKRHFVFPFKENVFEVLCDSLRIIGVFLDCSSALDEAKRRIK